MEVTKKYDGHEERTNLIEEYQSQGLTMLHDNFPPDWKRGEQPRGEMIFTDEPRPSQTTTARDLYAEVDELRNRLDKIEQG